MSFLYSLIDILSLEFMLASDCAVFSASKRSLIQSSPCDVAFNITTTFTFKLTFYAQIDIFEELCVLLHTYCKCHFFNIALTVRMVSICFLTISAFRVCDFVSESSVGNTHYLL